MREFNVAYFTASCDDVETNTRFAKELQLDYPILSDPDRKVARAYGLIKGTRPFPSRTTIYIDKKGKIAYIDKKVKPGQHGEDIVKKLQELKFEPAKRDRT